MYLFHRCSFIIQMLLLEFSIFYEPRALTITYMKGNCNRINENDQPGAFDKEKLYLATYKTLYTNTVKINKQDILNIDEK